MRIIFGLIMWIAIACIGLLVYNAGQINAQLAAMQSQLNVMQKHVEASEQAVHDLGTTATQCPK